MIIPKQVNVEITSKCNLHCLGCPYNETGSGEDMDVDFFKSIIDRIDFPTVVVPQVIGEPLLHSRCTELMKYIGDKKLPFYITTNGMIYNEELYDYILSGNYCYQVVFSLDGMPGTGNIEKTRPGSSETKVLANINRFIEERNRRSSNMVIGVKICRRGQDWGEIERYIPYWLDRSADYVIVGDLLENHNTPGLRTEPCQYFANNFMVIKSDGKMVLCAYNNEINKGRNWLGTLGRDDNLLEAYNNDAYTFYRLEQKVGRFHGPCQTCGFAYTGYGLTGTVRFRGSNRKIYFSRDYYNHFYSLKKKWKPEKSYEIGAAIAEEYYET